MKFNDDIATLQSMLDILNQYRISEGSQFRYAVIDDKINLIDQEQRKTHQVIQINMIDKIYFSGYCMNLHTKDEGIFYFNKYGIEA